MNRNEMTQRHLELKTEISNLARKASLQREAGDKKGAKVTGSLWIAAIKELDELTESLDPLRARCQ